MTWISRHFSASRWTERRASARGSIVAWSILVLLAAAVVPAPAKQIRAPMSRTYQIRYRNTEEFLPLVRALLSKKGVVTASPELNLLVITDLAPNLALVDSLFALTDRPTKQIRIMLQLIAGSDTETPDSTGMTETALGLIAQADYAFNTYRIFDSGLILTDSGNHTTLELAGGRYGVSFTPEFVAGERDIIQVRNFTLELRQRSLGRTSARALIATSYSIPDGITEMIGAAQLGREGETLFVIFFAEGL